MGGGLFGMVGLRNGTGGKRCTRGHAGEDGGKGKGGGRGEVWRKRQGRRAARMAQVRRES